MSNLPIVSASPHMKSPDSTRSIMLDVIVALLPALVMSIIFFGMRSLIITLISVASCMAFEVLYRFLMKKNLTVLNFSAAVTGVLLAFSLPPTVPYWLPIVGAFFAIVLVKELFGGIGKNFVNPALAARAFLFSWPVFMTQFVKPLDTVSSPTVLNILKGKLGMATPTFLQLLFGEKSGSLGETASLFLILGGLYLLYRKVISWHIPVSFLGTVAALTYLFPRGYEPFYFCVTNLFSGGLILGAVFMATDYSTSPITKKGKLIFGIGCGVLTVLFRYFGGYPEGVCYAILIMNGVTPLIDKYTKPTRYGTGRGAINV